MRYNSWHGGIHVSEQVRGEVLIVVVTCSRSVRSCTRCQRRKHSPPDYALIYEAVLNHVSTSAMRINRSSPKLQETIEKALEKDRELRYQSAGELRADLKRLKRDMESAQRVLQLNRRRPASHRMVAEQLRTCGICPRAL